MEENNSRENVIDAEFEEVKSDTTVHSYSCGSSNSQDNNQKQSDSSTATAALVLGIAGVVTAFTGKFAFIGLICSVIGLVLSSKERACNPSSTVTAAFVLSIIGIASAVIGIIVFILILAGSIAMFSFF